MGEVYRAHDARLNRDVALKVLPDAFVRDRDRLVRFQREAQALAALNHPHIAQILGLEETGAGPALVLEFVDGPTLADRIAHGPLPIDDALNIARQIASALEAAHDRGIVRRDLKPANVKMRPDGAVRKSTARRGNRSWFDRPRCSRCPRRRPISGSCSSSSWTPVSSTSTA
jgi:serine/threonine-protein kinase